MPAKVRLTDGLGRCDAAHVCDCQEAGQPCAREWVTYNPLTATYDTPDGTSVSAELVDNVQCLADVMHIAQIRAKQRAERPNARSCQLMTGPSSPSLKS
jgi:hypothetical protein